MISFMSEESSMKVHARFATAMALATIALSPLARPAQGQERFSGPPMPPPGMNQGHGPDWRHHDHEQMHHRPMGPDFHDGPAHDWRRGQRFDHWQEHQYFVDRWNAYHGLYAPPPGYRWTHYGNQFLLTAIATGIITAIVTSPYQTPGY